MIFIFFFFLKNSWLHPPLSPWNLWHVLTATKMSSFCTGFPCKEHNIFVTYLLPSKPGHYSIWVKTRVLPFPSWKHTRTSIKLLQNVCVSALRGQVAQYKEYELRGLWSSFNLRKNSRCKKPQARICHSLLKSLIRALEWGNATTSDYEILMQLDFLLTVSSEQNSLS